jgi:hypothetical protein
VLAIRASSLLRADAPLSVVVFVAAKRATFSPAIGGLVKRADPPAILNPRFAKQNVSRQRSRGSNRNRHVAGDKDRSRKFVPCFIIELMATTM